MDSKLGDTHSDIMGK